MDEMRDLKTADVARAGDEDPVPPREQITSRVEPEPAVQSGERDVVSFPRMSASEPYAARRELGVKEPAAGHSALVPETEAERFRTDWREIQSIFVDTPRQAVERADALVAAVMKRTAEVFARERESLEQQWDKGETVGTEDLRVVLQRYRAFFDRLLSI